ncbi:MAG: HAD domain-containing protein [Candidatus Dormibacteria bacterium]
MDIDGVVSPLPIVVTHYGNSTWREYTPELHPATWRDWRNIDLYEMPISDRMLAAIFALPVEVIWLTTWEDEANLVFGERLGLPTLPYIELPHSRAWSKRIAVSRWVAANPLRPVIWADDDPRIRRCREWLRTLQPQSLIVNPEKAIGLTPEHLDAMRRFLDGPEMRVRG